MAVENLASGDLADEYLVAPAVALRRPFRIVRLPLLSRLDRAYLKPRKRLLRHLVNKPARALLNAAYRLGLGGAGELSLQIGDRSKHLRFNARNLQFNVLYLPQFAHGYEIEALTVIERVLGPRGVFFDVGANWGYFSLYLASDPGFAGTIVAWEPIPTTFADLSGLVRDAGLEGRIACKPAALSDRNGVAAMALPHGMRSGIAQLVEGGAIAVNVARLDDLDLPAPDVIKLDVEEHEGEALAGAARVLERARPLIVFENRNDHARPDRTLAPFRLLERLGYRFYHLAWLAERNGVRAPMDFEMRAHSTADLALVPFVPAQRLLFSGGVHNIVACHGERVAELAQRLARPQAPALTGQP